MYLLVKFEIMVYKAFINYKRRVFEIDKIYTKYGRSKTEALINAYSIYDLKLRTIVFKNEAVWVRFVDKDKLEKLNREKQNLKTKLMELKIKEKGFKKC